VDLIHTYIYFYIFIFMVYLTVFSIAHITYYRIKGKLVNDELKRMWKYEVLTRKTLEYEAGMPTTRPNCLVYALSYSSTPSYVFRT
jgi:hypothetical protein